MKYFIFSNSPDYPMTILGIFKTLKEAKKYYGDGYYLTLRKCKWTTGKLPEYNETEKVILK